MATEDAAGGKPLADVVPGAAPDLPAVAHWSNGGTLKAFVADDCKRAGDDDTGGCCAEDELTAPVHPALGADRGGAPAPGGGCCGWPGEPFCGDEALRSEGLRTGVCCTWPTGWGDAAALPAADCGQDHWGLFGVGEQGETLFGALNGEPDPGDKLFGALTGEPGDKLLGPAPYLLPGERAGLCGELELAPATGADSGTPPGPEFGPSARALSGACWQGAAYLCCCCCCCARAAFIAEVAQ